MRKDGKNERRRKKDWKKESGEEGKKERGNDGNSETMKEGNRARR